MTKISRNHRLQSPQPCPFCGEMDIGFKNEAFTAYTHMRCYTCGAQGPQVRESSSGMGDKIEAMKEWNTRYYGASE